VAASTGTAGCGANLSALLATHEDRTDRGPPFPFVADEASALAEDDDCEEDLLSPAPDLTLQTLLEDELLLAMPLVPRHATCDKPLPQSLDQDLPHPFAALAGLKLGKP